METRIHTATNLYNYINNARQMENLEAQIASKKKELESIEALNAIYEKMGCMNMLEVSAEHANKIEFDILLLRLRMNKIEGEMIKFEIGTFLED